MTKPSDRYDRDLIKRLKLGEEKAVDEWFTVYHGRILAFIKKKISSDKDAEELAQETFVNCLKHLPLFRGKSSIFTWMCSIAKHEMADYYRKKYAKFAIRTLPLGEMLLASPIDDATEVSRKVKIILARMTKQQRELLLMKYVDKKKVKDIAKQLGRTAKAVESDLFRARGEFRAAWVDLE